MADLSITAANVVASSSATLQRGTAGVSVTAGRLVYRSASTGLFLLADSNAATAEVRVPVGVALHAADIGQPLTVAKAGDVTIGATMVANTAYYLSDTPGGICPVADLATGEYPCLLGLAISTTVLRLNIQAAPGAL